MSDAQMQKDPMNTARDLIYLVACALNETSPDPERCGAMDLDAVYSLAQFHFLTSAAAFALEKVMELPRDFDQAKKKAIRKQALFDIERTVIFREFDAAGIWYLPLKGIVLKDYYPKSTMREMTDNDVLCDSKKMAQIRAIMTRLGYTCEMYDVTNHDIYQKPPTLSFELHRELFYSNDYPKLHEYYRYVGDRLIADGGCAFRMTDEDFYLFLIAHAYKHYSHAGIGLRTLADVYVFLRSRGEALDCAFLEEELKKLGLADFESSFRKLAKKLFTGEPLSETENSELIYLLRSGVNGTEENAEHHATSARLGGDDSDMAKRRYFRKRILISGDDLAKNYPFVSRHKALYPLLLVYRPVKGLFTHPGWIIREYRRIKRFDKGNESAFNFQDTNNRENNN